MGKSSAIKHQTQWVAINIETNVTIYIAIANSSKLDPLNGHSMCVDEKLSFWKSLTKICSGRQYVLTLNYKEFIFYIAI